MKWLLVLSLLVSSLHAETLYSSTQCHDSSVNWTGDVSLLAWQAREEGLAFALNNANALSTTLVNGNLIGIDFKWEPAFKIELGADFPSRAWDYCFRWTHFHTETSHTANGNLIPLWVFPSANVAAQFLYGSAKASWELHFNEFDVELGYHPLLSPKLAIRFHAGLKIAILTQLYDTFYNNGFNDGTNQLLNAYTSLNNRSIGAGPRMGFDSKWELGRGFSLLASIAGSLPLWHYRINRNDWDEGLIAGTASNIDSFFWQRFWIFRPILETTLGAGWFRTFGCRKQYDVGIEASYEIQYFSEQNMMAMLVNPGVLNQVFEPRGDLTLHGATFTLHFGY